MKKKLYLAVLALCVALGTAACGNEAATENGKADTKTEQKEEKPATRLVTVKDLDKYVKLGEYKGLALEKTVEVVSEDDLQARIDEELMAKAVEISDAAAMGDLVTINFVGTKDGVAFDGGTANNYDLTLGNGGMIDGFEDGIVGMKKGETKDLNLTFPEDYMEQTLAGEDVVFKITCQNVRRKAELTDEWVGKNSEHKTVDEYREGMRKQLEEQAQEYAEAGLKNSAWQTFIGTCEILEYPQEDVENAKTEYKNTLQKYADQAGMTVEDLIKAQGMTTEQYEEQMQQYAEMLVKQDLVLQAVMDAEGMTLEDEESLKVQDELIQTSGSKDLAAMIDQFGQAQVDEAIALLRVEEFLVKNAEITEMAAGGDTTGANADVSADETLQAPDEEGEIDEELEESPEEAAEDDDTVVVDEE